MVVTFRKWELYLQLLMGLAIRSWNNRLWVLHSENGNCISNSLWVWPSGTGTTAYGSYLQKMGTVSINLWVWPSGTGTTDYGSCFQKMGTVSPTAFGLAFRNWDNRLWFLPSENCNCIYNRLWVWPSGTGTTDYGSCFQKMGTVSPTAFGLAFRNWDNRLWFLHSENCNCIYNRLWVWPSGTGTTDYGSCIQKMGIWERSGSVVECLTRDWGAADSSLIGITALCPWARTFILA